VFVRSFINRFFLWLIAHIAVLAGVDFATGNVFAGVAEAVGPLIVVLIILDSLFIAYAQAIDEYRETKQRQDLEFLGLYCINCRHLKKKIFGRFACALTGSYTTAGDSCAKHSEYSGRRAKQAPKAIDIEIPALTRI
jgi:hypothetical protein